MDFKKANLRKSYKYKKKLFLESLLSNICRDDNIYTLSFSGPNSELIIAGNNLEKYETERT